jgi:Asp-tRNA(Asn)/Glu-tRNA(Gln) amidotransferase A subunit family amidase
MLTVMTSWMFILIMEVAISAPAAAPTPADQRIQAAAEPITSATIAELEKILALTFTPAERDQMLTLLNGGGASSPQSYETLRQYPLLNSDPLPLLFHPLPLGFIRAPAQQPIVWGAPAHGPVSLSEEDLAFYSVRDLGALIRSHRITSLALTQLCLKRLKQYDPQLFCVITFTEDLALQQAARADAELAQGQDRGPLHGIPYGIKDLFSVRGYRTTWGAAPYQDQVLDEDATVVRRLEEAGAVLVAKLSTGALAMGDVWFGGTTRNPWNPQQGSSGSSAGPAAATAAGLVPFAIGTETLGSIVSPCTVCRVAGLRTTFGRVSRTGVMSLSWSMDKIGPIARTVEDCALVFEAIRGPDEQDLAVIDAPFNYDANRDVKTLRVGYRNVVSAQTLQRLAALVGQDHLVSVTLPNCPYNEMSLVLNAEAAAAFDELTRSGRDDLLTAQGNFDWPNTFRAARTIPAVEYLQANRLRHKLVQDMAAMMKDIDVFVTTQADDATLYVTNLTGQPCAVIPTGGATSLSIIGKPLDEATVLLLAQAYQGDPMLTAHWRLDETEGTVARDDQGGCDGVVHGQPIWQPTGGKIGGALQLDGVDDYIAAGPPTNPPQEHFSVWAWVKGGAAGQVILSQQDGTDWLKADGAQGRLTTDLSNPGTRVKVPPLTAGPTIADGGWHHVGLLWDGSARILYVDEVEVARDAPAIVSSGLSWRLYLGAGAKLAVGTFWSGLIDDVRSYNRAVKP